MNTPVTGSGVSLSGEHITASAWLKGIPPAYGYFPFPHQPLKADSQEIPLKFARYPNKYPAKGPKERHLSVNSSEKFGVELAQMKEDMRPLHSAYKSKNSYHCGDYNGFMPPHPRHFDSKSFSFNFYHQPVVKNPKISKHDRKSHYQSANIQNGFTATPVAMTSGIDNSRHVIKSMPSTSSDGNYNRKNGKAMQSLSFVNNDGYKPSAINEPAATGDLTAEYFAAKNNFQPTFPSQPKVVNCSEVETVTVNCHSAKVITSVKSMQNQDCISCSAPQSTARFKTSMSYNKETSFHSCGNDNISSVNHSSRGNNSKTSADTQSNFVDNDIGKMACTAHHSGIDDSSLCAVHCSVPCGNEHGEKNFSSNQVLPAIDGFPKDNKSESPSADKCSAPITSASVACSNKSLLVNNSSGFVSNDKCDINKLDPLTIKRNLGQADVNCASNEINSETWNSSYLPDCENVKYDGISEISNGKYNDENFSADVLPSPDRDSVSNCSSLLFTASSDISVDGSSKENCNPLPPVIIVNTLNTDGNLIDISFGIEYDEMVEICSNKELKSDMTLYSNNASENKIIPETLFDINSPENINEGDIVTGSFTVRDKKYLWKNQEIDVSRCNLVEIAMFLQEMWKSDEEAFKIGSLAGTG